MTAKEKDAIPTMPRQILVGDRCKIKAAKLRPYLQQYGETARATFNVSLIDDVAGKHRLYVGPPLELLWREDCELAWGELKFLKTRKERYAALTAAGTRL